MDDEALRTLTRQIQQRVGVDPEASIKPVDATCRECGKAIQYPNLNPTPGQAAEWNRYVERNRDKLTCRPCRDAQEAERTRQREEQARQRIEADHAAMLERMPAVLGEVGALPKWIGASFDECPDLPAEIVARVRAWAERPSGIMLLSGSPGSGKTWCATAAVRHALTQRVVKPHAVRMIGEAEYLAMLKAEMDSGACASEAVRGAGLLVFDDLGSCRCTDWSRGEVAGIVAFREARCLPTLITSNWPLVEIARNLDTRTASRIGGCDQIVTFPKRDLRMEGTNRHGGRASGQVSIVDT